MNPLSESSWASLEGIHNLHNVLPLFHFLSIKGKKILIFRYTSALCEKFLCLLGCSWFTWTISIYKYKKAIRSFRGTLSACWWTEHNYTNKCNDFDLCHSWKRRYVRWHDFKKYKVYLHKNILRNTMSRQLILTNHNTDARLLDLSWKHYHMSSNRFFFFLQLHLQHSPKWWYATLWLHMKFLCVSSSTFLSLFLLLYFYSNLCIFLMWEPWIFNPTYC